MRSIGMWCEGERRQEDGYLEVLLLLEMSRGTRRMGGGERETRRGEIFSCEIHR